MARKITIDIVTRELKDINPNIEILSKQYVNAKTKLECRCVVDGYKWTANWNNLKSGFGCPKCGIRTLSKKQRLTIDEVRKRLNEINPYIEILSEKYINAQTKLNCRCKVDNHEWKATWNNLSKGSGCPKCKATNNSKRFSLTLNTVKNELERINPNIKILSDKYINNTSMLKCKCLIDGHEWKANWSNLQQGKGCPKCAVRNVSGQNCYAWKGGITPLYIYLRNTISPWKRDSFKKYNYRCAITGTNKHLTIHHLYNFSDILEEVLKKTKLPLYQEIGKYTNKELRLLEDTCLQLHYKYGLGICLTRKIHEEFHSLYGRSNNTREQFEEFRQMKINNNAS